ncbi:dihydrolipoyl dehydrogenase [Halosquirtibacter laminarini]|uniref:Dihydrolipoyl dehydrogenase n=1 Tax=Halosquirtibacter laminarini TaxID=3374600 RepID=A0AC61NFR4_9BACT|nr:dihydrolipoyl dehydrogenase [Prolixibacteraceae bacterium]
MTKYDIVVLGSGPGGYVAAIRASHLGFKVAVIEKENLGGICLNWGCIPTKALLKSAHVFEQIKHAQEYGISIDTEPKVDFTKVIERSRGVASGMSKGIDFLMKKNKIDVIMGFGTLISENQIEVASQDEEKKIVEADHIILATGARSKELPSLPQDGKRVIGYREAMTLPQQPKSMIVVGSGAIGCEFANFYNAIGTKVTIVEFLPNIVPNEDIEVSKQLGRSFKKAGIKVMTKAAVQSVETTENGCIATISTKKGEEKIEAEVVLSAVGVTPNIENIGLENVGVTVEKNKVVVNDFYQTNIPSIYAIGDIVKGQALAHVASAEGIVCVEKIAGKSPRVINYNNIPGCTYTSPEVASVGLTEAKATELGHKIKVGKFPFSASGKASAANAKEGFVKLIFDEKYGELLGAHMIGANVTEMIGELVVGKDLEITAHELINAVHPHPTMNEAIMEAAAAAYDEVIHI